MPIGEGYWISPMGELVEISEHFEFVRENPELFGFTSAQMKKYFGVTPKNRAGLRQELLTEAIRRDWIRLRLTNEWHFQCWRLDEWTLERIRQALTKLHAGDHDFVILSELSRGRHDEVRAGEVLSDEAHAWVAGLGDVCCICASGLVPGMGIGDIGVRPVCVQCDAFPLQEAM